MIIKQSAGARMGAEAGAGGLALLCAIGIAATGTRGQVVLFDNFGPGDSFQTNSGYVVGGPFGDPQFESAMAFTADDNYLLTSGEFAVSLSFNSPNPATFAITVYADDGDGLPGAALEQVTVVEDLISFGLSGPPVAVDFAGTTALLAGEQYWIGLSADSSNNLAWNHNNTGDLGPHAFAVDGGPWNLSSKTATRSAFRLHGTLVPTPGAIALLGLFACAARGRRRGRGGV